MSITSASADVKHEYKWPQGRGYVFTSPYVPPNGVLVTGNVRWWAGLRVDGCAMITIQDVYTDANGILSIVTPVDANDPGHTYAVVGPTRPGGLSEAQFNAIAQLSAAAAAATELDINGNALGPLEQFYVVPIAGKPCGPFPDGTYPTKMVFPGANINFGKPQPAGYGQ
jgi:hypothetical protein